MKTIIGFKKDNYKFVLEREFNHNTCYFESVNDYLTSRLYINLHPELCQKSYRVSFKHNKMSLNTTGLSNNFSIWQEKDIFLYSYRYGFEYVNYKNHEHYFIDFEKGIINKERTKGNEELNNNTELETLANQKYSFYLKKYNYYTNKIKNKCALEFELKTNILVSLQMGCIPLENYIDFDNFFKHAINREESFEYIRINASYDNFVAKYPQISTLSFDKAFIKNKLQESINFYCKAENEIYLFEEIEQHDFLDFEKELNSIFAENYNYLKTYKENHIKIDKLKLLKQKYSLKSILDLKALEIEEIIDKNDLVSKLRLFLSRTPINSEKKFISSLNAFFDSYKKFEQDCLSFINKYKSNEYIIDLNSDLESKFKLFEKGEIELSNDELDSYNDVYNILIKIFINSIYQKNTNKLKPTFRKFPSYIQWVINLFNWLIENDIIAKDGSCFMSENIKNLLNIPYSLCVY